MGVGRLEAVRRSFRRQAAGFDEKGLTLTDRRLLAWAVKGLAPRPGHEVLDVAAGTGILARFLAPEVRRVVALDLVPAMIAEGRRRARAAGLENVAFRRGDARRLPFAAGAFDRVVTRLSLHHVSRPVRLIREMARACAPGGRVAIVDLTVRAGSRLAACRNRMERRRDPSHVRALGFRELVGLVRAAGLRIARAERREVAVDLGRWLALAGVGRGAAAAIRRELETELEGGRATGLRPFRVGGILKFRQTWAAVVGVKPKDRRG